MNTSCRDRGRMRGQHKQHEIIQRLDAEMEELQESDECQPTSH